MIWKYLGWCCWVVFLVFCGILVFFFLRNVDRWDALASISGVRCLDGPVLCCEVGVLEFRKGVHPSSSSSSSSKSLFCSFCQSYIFRASLLWGGAFWVVPQDCFSPFVLLHWRSLFRVCFCLSLFACGCGLAFLLSSSSRHVNHVIVLCFGHKFATISGVRVWVVPLFTSNQATWPRLPLTPPQFSCFLLHAHLKPTCSSKIKVFGDLSRKHTKAHPIHRAHHQPSKWDQIEDYANMSHDDNMSTCQQNKPHPWRQRRKTQT